ncbi:hypothetical protein [Streptomyces sp. NPDC000410]|uniref:hypothetical protein n=1 Tax=Streptomyces sp. NPDC000410 TaxID=3154254 RepID=UPI00332E201E
MAKESFSPLLPDGETLEEKHSEFRSRLGAACSVSVDGRKALSVNLLVWDRPADPVDWESLASQHPNAAKREVAFPGDAVIGSDYAVLQAKCDSSPSYMSFVFYFRGDRVEDTPEGYEKLQRFINEFVPPATKRFGCTK